MPTNCGDKEGLFGEASHPCGHNLQCAKWPLVLSLEFVWQKGERGQASFGLCLLMHQAGAFITVALLIKYWIGVGHTSSAFMPGCLAYFSYSFSEQKVTDKNGDHARISVHHSRGNHLCCWSGFLDQVSTAELRGDSVYIFVTCTWIACLHM